MVYVVLKAPALTGAMFSKQGFADDLVSQTAMMTAALVSGGKTLLGKSKSGNSVLGG